MRGRERERGTATTTLTKNPVYFVCFFSLFWIWDLNERFLVFFFSGASIIKSIYLSDP